MNLGVFRFDYNFKEKKFKARIFPSSIYGTIVTGSQARLNIKKTLQTGIMIYERDGSLSLLGNPAGGIGIVSSIGIDKNITGSGFYDLMAHEAMHILQYDNLVWLNPQLNKLDAQWKTNSRCYEQISKFVYFDFNGLMLYGIYLTQLNQPWICRMIEREAEIYSKRRTIPRCN